MYPLKPVMQILPNNEHNEPTQGDIGETSNKPTQATRNDFEELYASANEELFPGCDYVTRLDFMAKFTYFKAKGRLTDSIFNEMLEFFDNSSDLPLSTSLNDLDNATLHIDGQSTVVDAPPDIIDVHDEDDDIISDEDALPHDLADSDVEDLVNVDDDVVEKVYSSEEED
ncbi:hypothetical protein Tco_0450854 [Tanacetum coccineum]